MLIRTAISGALLATVALGVTTATTTISAQAATRHTVCADDLYVREHAQGVMIGLLVKGDHFDTDRTSPSGAYSYGHAYGEVNKDGWVQTSGLC